ncbi:TetR/AcrR family transcriptional regulator [Actinomycetospora atypica]|uniref:TetR/AcrR family transcriptional regulator n=1 Tax=Actinomycetospora atypica TaxID=1290095 RepID=A0ABV9YJ72_9PSEU
MARRSDARDRVLAAVQELVLAGDAAPTFDAIAARSGVSKGGVLHHFRDRGALVRGLAERAVSATDEVMTAASERGDAARTWLRMSAAQGPDHQAARAMLSLMRVEAGGRIELGHGIDEAVTRWQAMIAAELGDEVLAAVVRLVGDGLFAATLADTVPAPGELEEIYSRLLGPGPVRTGAEEP